MSDSDFDINKCECEDNVLGNELCEYCKNFYSFLSDSIMNKIYEL